MSLIVHTDVDECANRNSNECHENADCFNTDGSYTCCCRRGYHGNGFMCEGGIIVGSL